MELMGPRLQEGVDPGYEKRFSIFTTQNKTQQYFFKIESTPIINCFLCSGIINNKIENMNMP